MPPSAGPASSGAAVRKGRPALKKKTHSYHHGDLPRAMLAVTIEMIRKHGVVAVTLRGVGDELGVSRTALYRHFANKDALLAAVAREGFATLRTSLLSAWRGDGGGQKGFNQMGKAYVRFARQHPSHYQVMFGGYVNPASLSAGPAPEDYDAFGPLVNAIVELQQTKVMRADDPQLMAMYIWSVVHGVAMLALTGMCPDDATIDQLTAFAIERLRTGTEQPTTGTA